MKNLFFTLFLSFSCFSQDSINNYIISNNFASEAEFYFHEQHYDSAVYYYELAFGYVTEPHPMQRYKYAKALWETGKKGQALIEVIYAPVSKIDTNWFSGLSSEECESVNNQIRVYRDLLTKTKNTIFYRSFMDSIMEIDEFQRKKYLAFMDSLTYIKPYPKQFMDSIGPIKWETVEYYDSCNAEAVINFTRKYGFPAGKNAGWDQTAATFLIHMLPEWFIENYALLYNEVVKGNLEPWMLARGIDRKFTVEIGEDKINPYNRYWKESVINPFLMFYNCVSLGVSPYYDSNWSGKPGKTIHFDYYKENKKYYNTTFEYPHNSK